MSITPSRALSDIDGMLADVLAQPDKEKRTHMEFALRHAISVQSSDGLDSFKQHIERDRQVAEMLKKDLSYSSISKTNSKGQTVLHCAAESKSLASLQVLLNEAKYFSSVLDAKDNDGNTFLHLLFK